jgi:hypothetical protein
MITTRTVLILGAGSSCHLGYPLGRSLISQICKRIADHECPAEIPRDKLTEFRVHLSRFDSASIDFFLERNPEYTDLGKLLITDCLKQYEELERMFVPHSAGWYRYLADSLQSPDGFVSAPLTIVTFNYDRSLEAYLHQILIYRHRMSTESATQTLQQMRILHPHGILGRYPETPYTTKYDGISLSSISGDIRLIYEPAETDGGFCAPEFETANRALQEAERIYFLGFGFHEDNIRRFRFFSAESLAGKEVHGTTLGMGARAKKVLRQRLARFGFSQGFDSSSDCYEFFSYKCGLD